MFRKLEHAWDNCANSNFLASATKICNSAAQERWQYLQSATRGVHNNDDKKYY